MASFSPSISSFFTVSCLLAGLGLDWRGFLDCKLSGLSESPCLRLRASLSFPFPAAWIVALTGLVREGWEGVFLREMGDISADAAVMAEESC